MDAGTPTILSIWLNADVDIALTPAVMYCARTEDDKNGNRVQYVVTLGVYDE